MNQPSHSHHRCTFADYLADEDASNVKHELFNGEIHAMTGGTPEHAALAAAITTLIGAQLGEGPCRAFSSDLKVRALATGLVSYPDLTVICGPVEYDPQSRMVAVDPTMIVEVLSDSTEDWNGGEKLENFKQLPSLRECLLVSHRTSQIDLWSRGPDGSWSHRTAPAGDTVELRSIGGSLRVDDVYRGALGADGPRRGSV
jgi:Uma2 family endonuclease